MRWFNRAALLAVIAVVAMTVAPAFAQAPQPWQLGMQDPATPVQDMLNSFHNELLVIITVISLFVLGLLIVTMLKFRADRNPTPTRATHNTLLEILWTVVPIIILVVIAIPSFKLLYFGDRVAKADMTIKVTGHQWYWSYEYPDQDNIQFDSYMVQDSDLKPGQPRLLETDNRLVVPVDTNVRVLIAGTDVIHSWFIPSFGVQTYAMPGRTNETWFRASKAGVFYGQCNQICGVNHAYMPIAIEVVSKEQFGRWLVDAKKKFAGTSSPTTLALAESN
ncbi:MAG: cytochrome c oxidase subunit II [Micropepsaceae bacterium]